MTQALDNKISLEKAKNRSGRQFCKKLEWPHLGVEASPVPRPS